MNDARMSVDQIAYERARERETLRTQARELALSGRAPGRPRGILSDEEAAARQAFRQTGTLQEVARTASAPTSSSSASAPAMVGLSFVSRLGIFALVILLIGILWIKQRKRRPS